MSNLYLQILIFTKSALTTECALKFIIQISGNNFKIHFFFPLKRSGTNCLKNKPCDVKKMRKMRGKVEKETPKKEMDNPSFL